MSSGNPGAAVKLTRGVRAEYTERKAGTFVKEITFISFNLMK